MTVGLLSFGAQQFPFSGGKSQVGIGFLGFENDYPFINVVKTAQQWANISGGSTALDPRNFDANGYPTSLPGASSSGITMFLYIPTQTQRSGRWAITWTNIQPGQTSTIFVNGWTQNSPTGGKSTTGATGRYEFLPSTNDHGGQLGIVTANVTNLQMFHVNDETDLNAGKMFTRDFKNLLQAMKPGVIRFGDWINMNTSMITTWATRKPIGYVFFAYPEMRSSITAGSTNPNGTDTGDHYTINFNDPVYGNGAPVDKQTIHVLFDRSSVGNTPDLNLNGTGAVPLALQWGVAIGPFSNHQPLANLWGTLIYDAALNVWLQFGGNSDANNKYLDNGVPPEVILRLCIETGCNPHWTAPYLACDPKTDWFTQLHTYSKANGVPWMVPRQEGVNELWNGAGGFYQTPYARSKQLVRNSGQRPYDASVTFPVTAISWTGSGASGSSTLTVTGTLPPLGARVQTSGSGWTGVSGFSGSDAYVVARGAGTVTINTAPTAGTNPTSGLSAASLSGNASDENNWYGRVISDIGQDLNAVYGGAVDGTKYKVLCGVHTGTFDTAPNAANSNSRVASTNYALASGTNNTPDLTKCAFNWITDLCCAQYFQPGDYKINAEVIKAYRYAGGDTTALDDYCDTLPATSSNFTLPTTNTLYQNIFAFAQNNWGNSAFVPGSGSKKFGMRGYEGGWSPDFVLSDTTSPISAATKDASGIVVTLATTNVSGGSAQSGPALDSTSINVARITLSGLGGMVEANGLTGTVIGVGVGSGLSANQVRLNIDSSGFTTYTSGGTGTYIGPSTSSTIGNNASSQVLLNALRNDAMFSARLSAHTTTNYNNFVGAGGLDPSQYTFSGTAKLTSGSGVVGNGSVWGMFRESIYSSPHSSAYEAITTFNNS